MLQVGLDNTRVDDASPNAGSAMGNTVPLARLRASRHLQGLKLRAGASPDPTVSRPPLLKPWAEPNSGFTPRAAPMATPDAQSVQDQRGSIC